MRTSVSLLRGVSVLLLCGLTVSMNVRPNLQQFFSEDSVSLSCDEDGQTVKRTTGGQTQQCGSGFGSFTGSSCTVSSLSPPDSGLYWCETSSGNRILEVNITVIRPSGKALILEIPSLPVQTGSDVTLRCRDKDGSRAAYFFMNNLSTRRVVQEFTISNVHQSDEGFYSCSTELIGPTAESRLRVRAPPPPPPPPPSLSLIRLICHLVVFCPYCVSTGLMVALCCSRRTGNRPAVSMEMSQLVEVYDDIADDVTTMHDL